MTIIWTETAKLSYAEELAFIHKKWEKLMWNYQQGLAYG